MAIAICGKMFSSNILFYICVFELFSFANKKIHEVLPKLMEKKKQVYVLPKLVDCMSFNNKFWLMDVQGGTCYFCFCDLNFLKSN
jgi:hypothetical protein